MRINYKNRNARSDVMNKSGRRINHQRCTHNHENISFFFMVEKFQAKDRGKMIKSLY